VVKPGTLYNTGLLDCHSLVIKTGRLRWLEHVECTADIEWIKRCTINVEWTKPRWHTRKTWVGDGIKEDMKRFGL